VWSNHGHCRPENGIQVFRVQKYSLLRLNSLCMPCWTSINPGGGLAAHLLPGRGGHRHLQIGRMLDIDQISEPPHAPSSQMYASKVRESLWPEGQEANHS
jgi:hypothetical protein